MKKLLCLLLLAIPFFASSSDESRSAFLQAYYEADFEEAHDLLHRVHLDPATKDIWEYRIHLQHHISECSRIGTAIPSSRAMALARIGRFIEAREAFQDDWLSHWGLATLSLWKRDWASVRMHIERALALEPERPELLFFAGDVAATREETKKYFERFLALESDDEYKRSVARNSIEFMERTAGLELNIVSMDPGIAELDSKLEKRRGLLVRALVNGNEKVWLMVDTGAAGITLERRDWKPHVEATATFLGLGKDQISTGTRLVLNLFQVGPLHVKKPVAAITQSLPSSDIDGIAGTFLFSSHRILLPFKSGRKIHLLPYEQNTSEFFTEKKWKFSHRETFPFYFVNKLMVLKGKIRDSPEDMDILLDTGAETTLISLAAAKQHAYINLPLSMQMRGQASLTGVGGRADNMMIAENVEVLLGSMKKNFNSMLAVNLAGTSEGLELELDIILGRDFLEGYTLLIDYKNREVTFLR